MTIEEFQEVISQDPALEEPLRSELEEITDASARKAWERFARLIQRSKEE
jgi:hypothetical protein